MLLLFNLLKMGYFFMCQVGYTISSVFVSVMLSLGYSMVKECPAGLEIQPEGLEAPKGTREHDRNL